MVCKSFSGERQISDKKSPTSQISDKHHNRQNSDRKSKRLQFSDTHRKGENLTPISIETVTPTPPSIPCLLVKSVDKLQNRYVCHRIFFKFSKQSRILKTACLFFLCIQVFEGIPSLPTSCFPILTYKKLPMQSLKVTIAKSCLQEFPSGEEGFLLFEIPNIHFF